MSNTFSSVSLGRPVAILTAVCLAALALPLSFSAGALATPAIGRELAGGPVEMNKLNIEGLAYHQQTGQLLLGLRAPKAGDRSIIVPLLNPGAMFDDAAPPRRRRKG